MKKIINSSNNVVKEMLMGMIQNHKNLAFDTEHNIIHRKEGKRNKVGLVSGGGSGHEPAHSGYVGYGMLDVAVVGNVFASPDPFSILEGIKKADCGAGVLLIVKNYSGDVMNFSMAEDLAKDENIDVRTVLVNDDIAIEDPESRRGIAGTVLIHKIAGAAAEMGKSLDEVESIANAAVNSVRSIGFSLSSCTIPEVGKPIFEIAENELELGMGIHGEPGLERRKMMDSNSLASFMIDKILENTSENVIENSVAVLINGLGSTTLMELYILFNDVSSILKNKGISVGYSLVGNYMTSLEMAGSSLTILPLNDDFKQLLEYPSETPSLKVEGKL